MARKKKVEPYHFERPYTQRDKRGRFAKGNIISHRGGTARARKLSAERRKEIARMGYEAMVQKHFKGDFAEANNWLRRKALWAQDRQWQQLGLLYIESDPGPHPARRQTNE